MLTPRLTSKTVASLLRSEAHSQEQTDQVSLSKYLLKSVIFCSAPRVKLVKQIFMTGAFLAMLYTLGGIRQPSDAMSQS